MGRSPHNTYLVIYTFFSKQSILIALKYSISTFIFKEYIEIIQEQIDDKSYTN